MRYSRSVVLALLLFFSGGALGDAFETDLLETEDLRLLYFDPLTTYLTPHVIRSFENSLEFQKEIFSWVPWEKTTVMLQDFSDYGNAAALSSPRNLLWVDVAPLNHSFETFPAIERIYMLMNHELVHVATGDGWNEQDRWWRNVFRGKPSATGKHPETILYAYLTTPRKAAPRWYFEGSAVFMETWMSGGIGRAQGAYDEMVFRAMVRDDAHFYSNLGLVSEGTAIDFQTLTNAYLYGTRFLSYLAFEYSPEQVIEWLSREEDSKRYYSDQFKWVFGAELETVWDGWIEWEQSFQQANLESVRSSPITEKQALTQTALGSISRSFIDEDARTMVGGFYFPGVVAHVGVMSLEDGQVRRLADIKGPMKYRVTSTAYDEKTQTLFYTADNLRFRDLMAVDVKSGETRMLLEDARIGDLAFNRADDSLWGLRHLNGYVTLVRMKPPYESWSQVYTWPYGQVMSDIDISPDGTMLSATMEDVSGNQYLRLFRIIDLLDGYTEPLTQFEFGRAIPEGFVFSPDGRYLFGSSYYTGVSNIFRYEVDTGEIEAVSNAETGFFQPIPLSDGTLVVFEYTGKGFVPTRIDPVPLDDVGAISLLGNEIAKKHPVVRDWAVGSPADIDADALTTRKGRYRPRREMAFASVVPIIEGYRDTVSVGANLIFEDPMMFNSISADFSYSPDSDLDSDERFHVDVEYHKLNWRFRYWHNDADFYDLFGPTERSRKGDAFIIGYKDALIFDEPRRLDLDTELAYFTGLDTLPGNQNVEADFEDLLTGKVELIYNHTKRSLGAVDHEKGLRWKVAGLVDYADNETFPRLLAGLDFGFALPIKHSSVWLYNAAGIADGDRDSTLANWYFGAFGNNYVDDREIKRYREYHSFPGFEIDEISGQDFFRTLLEWNLPPIRFREIGTPSFFLQNIRSAVFAGGMITDIGDSEFEETYSSLGAQFDLNFTIVHRLPMTLSIGYAQGFVDGEKWDEEWMVSLKIL